VHLLLPAVQDFRSVGRLLSMKAKYEVARRDFDEAMATGRDVFTLAYRLQSDGETFVQNLVGIAFVGVLMHDSFFVEWIRSPGSPNLYWALAEIPPYFETRQIIAGDLRAAIDKLRDDATLRVLFLESSDEALVQRYETARRAHPLSGTDRVVDGIARERALLADLRAEADLVIDTTNTNVHQLRDRLIDAFGTETDEHMVVNVVSFGFKNGTPRDADIVLDVRFLPNPHWVDELRPYSGLDEPVREYVLGQPETATFLARLGDLFDVMVPAFQHEGKRYLTVAIGCTGGKHRSVVLAEELARHIRALGVAVKVDHRDRLEE
jgi:RNase adapter protein RapZ